MKKITIWKLKDKKGDFQHNHIEDGHVEGDRPTPKFPNQKTWLDKGREWQKEHAWLDNNGIIVR